MIWLGAGCGCHAKGMLTACDDGVGSDYQRRSQAEDRQGPADADRRGGSVVRRTGRTPSGREWQGAQSRQGSAELVFPGPALGQMQSELARRAGEPSGQGEEASSEGLGGHRCPASTIFAGSCCLIQKCYRNFSTWGPSRPALIPALQRVPPWAHQPWRRPAFWP